MDLLVTIRIIVEGCHNNKTDLLCCFVAFRKYFDTMPRTNLWNMLEELKVVLELRGVVVRLYENVLSKFKNTEGWSEEINYSTGVKKDCPLSLNLFGTYIDKLEDWLEDPGCVSLTLVGIFIILLLYVDYIILMARSP
jgi:hypothetical protein